MRKIILIILILSFLNVNIFAYEYNGVYGKLSNLDKKILNFQVQTCENIKLTDIPTIFVPGIAASWYSEEGYNETKVKRWIPDPITHVYDTLFYTFKQNGYDLKDVFYDGEFELHIEGNPKKSLYLFGYDWKKDNKVSATLLNQLIEKIEQKYYEDNGCYIGKVNIIAHSMGGLVARSMLEDMCVSDEALENFYNRKGLKKGELKNFVSQKCNYDVKIHTFITIATPHRGSPKSFPLWEKGNLEMTDGIIPGQVLKRQLFSVFDTSIYGVVHGYEDRLPNGVVTIGQLLPDIGNDNIYNEKLKYLTKNGKVLDNKVYPKNSFLEELNKEENIKKGFNKIENKFISYYSKQTGNYKNNNIIGYILNKSTTLYQTEDNYIRKPNDITDQYSGIDIYEKYNTSIYSNIYNIDKIIRNENGLGGDGTVPTQNLLLVANNSINTNEFKNTKFKSVELKCYNENILNDFSDDTEVILKSNLVSKKIGKDSHFEICNHTNTPILSAVKVYNNISGNVLNGEKIELLIQERKKLVAYIGKANYTDNYINNLVYGEEATLKSSNQNNKSGMRNNTYISSKFNKENYSSVWDNKKLMKDFNRLNYPDLNKIGEYDDPEWMNLNLPGTFGKLDRVLSYDIRSPINITIENELGQKIGINPQTGMIENTIPGAWTSGDTEGSNEPEFFLIPVTGTGKIKHTIKTYGTGDGEYHIAMSEITESTPSPLNRGLEGGGIENNKGHSKVIIQGNARSHFGEDYSVQISDTETTFINLTEQIPPTLSIEKLNIKTTDDNFTLRYNIRGKSKNIDAVIYSIKNPLSSEKNKEGKIEITGEIIIPLRQEGIYEIVIGLLDEDGNPLTNKESIKEVIIGKIPHKKINVQTEIGNIYNIDSNKNIVYNQKGSQLRYKMGKDNNIYRIKGKGLYKIDINTKKSERLFVNNTTITEIYISKNGDIYFFDGDIKKYSKNKLIILKKNVDRKIINLSLEGEKLYFLEKGKAGYGYIYLDTGKIIYNDDDIYYNSIGIKYDEENINYLEINPEFELKYRKKIEKIKKYIYLNFSDKQKQKLKQEILNYYTVIDMETDTYKKEKILFILHELNKVLYSLSPEKER